ncbi:hypothetical protein SAMN04488009_1553 [Maribacter sedimenticola]|uniref:Uncharacterized protein n=1 Tax=Maribacter sedimenticola TaxID=228956 RepID=A0ABY1SFI3_9FLAO|nr:hypothetical protein [Maribacter sedimenticola]SNR42026.1 hypothetical protein SAMN04488009_1553 [Maribacter sedimenticola]
MKPTKNIEVTALDIYNKWLHCYLNVYAKTYVFNFNYDTCFNGTSLYGTFLIRSTTTNLFTGIIEQGSTSESIIHRSNFGVSMSYDMVPKPHDIEFHETKKEGEGTTFIINLRIHD